MCGYKEGDFSINAHCSSDESCVGPTKDDPLSKRVASFRKEELCVKSIGKMLLTSRLMIVIFIYLTKICLLY